MTTKIPLDVGQMDTKLVKPLFPPNSVPWKSRGDAAWHCQVSGWPHSINRSARKYGDDMAILIVLSLAWWQHSILNGTPYVDAGVEGLIDEVELEKFLTG